MFVPVDIAALAITIWSVADSVPSLKVEGVCRAIAERVAPFADMKRCLHKEQETRAQLMHTWVQFHPSDRAHCVRLTTAGSVGATYTALLTCLELQRDARNIREMNQGSTTGLRSR
jgi:hypothetical protein